MKCENVTCQNFINTASKCNKCESKFCSNSCMIDHFFEKHKSEKEESSVARSLSIASIKKQQRKSSVSSFAKSGQILTEVKTDNYFKFENFEKVKVGKKTQVLGSGAFGDVYLIKHKLDGKLFAVKKMDKDKISNSGASLDIVRREIDIHSRLLHENIVRLYSSYEDKLSFHLILEYANSGTLFGAIKKNKSMEEKKAFKYFIQTASALYFLHENNLIHRDIKPENLLLDSNDNVKLCDFGWCIELEIGNRKTFCGTIEYMAPEIVKEMPYDGAIDVWSLGVLLYELLHGYSPFRALQNQNEDAEAAEVFRNIVKVQYKIDRKDISENCKDLIKKLLTPEISSRMKIKDVFSHPWVLNFEKENKAESLNNSESSKLNKSAVDKLNYSENLGLKKMKELEMELKKIENMQNVSEEKNLKYQSGSEIKNVKNSKNDDSLEKIKDNLNYHKKNSIKQALDSSDFQLENFHKGDSLFDKVLTQVKERNQGQNKDKKKKSKILEENIYDNMDMGKIQNEKIVLRLEKEKDRPLKTEEDFIMLSEIKQIEKDIDSHILDQNKRIQEINGVKSDINKILEKDKSREGMVILKGEDNFNLLDEADNNLHAVSQDLVMNLHPKFVKEEKKLQQESNFKKPPIERKPHHIPVVENYNDHFHSDKRDSHKRRNSKARESYKKSFLEDTKDSEKYKNQKDPNKELDMSFLPKDLLYNNQSFQDSNKNLLSAIELLEKAQKKREEEEEQKKPDEKTFWEKVGSFLNPFKCG